MAKVSQKSNHGPQDVPRPLVATVQAIEVREQTCREAHAARFEKELGVHPTNVHGQHAAGGNRAGRQLQVARDT